MHLTGAHQEMLLHDLRSARLLLVRHKAQKRAHLSIPISKGNPSSGILSTADMLGINTDMPTVRTFSRSMLGWSSEMVPELVKVKSEKGICTVSLGSASFQC